MFTLYASKAGDIVHVDIEGALFPEAPPPGAVHRLTLDEGTNPVTWAIVNSPERAQLLLTKEGLGYRGAKLPVEEAHPLAVAANNKMQATKRLFTETGPVPPDDLRLILQVLLERNPIA